MLAVRRPQPQLEIWDTLIGLRGAVDWRALGVHSTGGIRFVFMDEDSVLVYGSGGGWVMISSHSLQTGRRLRGNAITIGPQSAVHLGGGVLASTGWTPHGNDRYWFHISNRDGDFIRSFAKRRPGLPRDLAHVAARPISPAGRGTFWALPGPGEPYALELWDSAGTMLRRIERTAGWAKPEAGRDDPLGRVFPAYLSVHRTRSGLLWVVMLVRDPMWQPIKTEADEVARASKQFDFRFEVLHPDHGVLVSGRIDEMDAYGVNGPPLLKFIQGTDIGLAVQRSDTGTLQLEAFGLELRALQQGTDNVANRK